MGVDVALASPRVDDPHIADTEIEVVCDLFLRVARPVVSGKNLDYQERRRAKDLLLRLPADVNAHIRHSETGALDLNRLPRKTVGSQGGFLGNKERDQLSLRSAVVFFAQVSLHNSTVDVLAVTVSEARAQILFRRNWCGRGLHVPIVRLNLRVLDPLWRRASSVEAQYSFRPSTFSKSVET